jgi:uncharacterized membrane protein YphA (DoxX/SURF4 family)
MKALVVLIHNRALGLVLRLGLCVVFLYAGFEKWRDAKGFVEQIANYQLLPELAHYAALLLPPVEIAAAVAVLAAPRLWRVAGATLMFAMLLMFTVAMARAWSLGINIECGCFGKGSPTIGPLSFLRNTGLMIASVGLVAVDRA